MQPVRQVVRAVPFPFLGYVLGLVGFVFLGSFVAALAGGHAFAPVIGVASAVFFIAMVMCFRARAYQIAHADRGDERLSMDPMRPAEDPGASARYLMIYRGIGSRPVRARKPRAASGQMSGGTGAARTSVAADPDVHALSQ